MAVPRGEKFRRLAGMLDEELKAAGQPLRPGAAEALLARQVEITAAALHVSEGHTLRTYFSEDWPAEYAANFLQALEGERSAQDQLPPLVLDVADAGQLVAALAQAVRYASVNAGYTDEQVAAGLVQMSADAMSSIGEAIRNADGGRVVEVRGVAHGWAAEVLGEFAERLSDGSWISCRCGQQDAEHVDDARVLQQVLVDLALVN